MAVELNANDVFEMAEQVEREGRLFYKRIAETINLRPDVRQAFLRLAQMEQDHEQVFAAMRLRSSAGGSGQAGCSIDSAHEGWIGLAQILASGVLERLRERFGDRDAGDRIIQTALEFEKDTVMLLLSVKNMVSNAVDAARIDALIQEELGHILTLNSEMATVHNTRRASNGLSTSSDIVHPQA